MAQKKSQKFLSFKFKILFLGVVKDLDFFNQKKKEKKNMEMYEHRPRQRKGWEKKKKKEMYEHRIRERD